MMVIAENEHFRKEDKPSLVKAHAYASLYYKGIGKPKYAKAFLTSSSVKKLAAKIEKK